MSGKGPDFQPTPPLPNGEQTDAPSVYEQDYDMEREKVIRCWKRESASKAPEKIKEGLKKLVGKCWIETADVVEVYEEPKLPTGNALDDGIQVVHFRALAEKGMHAKWKETGKGQRGAMQTCSKKSR